MTELQFKFGDKAVITNCLSAEQLGPLPLEGAARV